MTTRWVYGNGSLGQFYSGSSFKDTTSPDDQPTAGQVWRTLNSGCQDIPTELHPGRTGTPGVPSRGTGHTAV